jgi:methylmalonyl-CoA mutase N-terminal domain/subunit
MFESKEQIEAAQGRWEQQTLWPSLERTPERDVKFMTTSSAPVERLYTPLDLQENDYLRDIGHPGEYPYTRGVHPTGYRGKVWTMRMFAGFGTAEETNARFRYLLDQGPLTCRRSTGAIPTTRWLRASSASAAWPSPRWPIWRFCSTASRSIRSARA